MKETIGIYAAKTQLSRLIDRAMAGEKIVITRNGVEVAELRPVATERPSPEVVVASFAAFQKKHAKSGPRLRRRGESLRELMHRDHER